MIGRRNFIKLLFAAPAVKAIDIVASNEQKENKYPKAILIDPYQVNINDLRGPQWKTKPSAT